MLEAEIKTTHKEIHDSLSEDYYQNKLMSKEEFDYLHGQNWNDMQAQLIAEGYRKLPEPVRDPLAEFKALEERVKLLEDKLKDPK